MAYAAVLSLDRILEHLSNPSRLEQHQTPLQDQQIKSLHENLNFLLDFLDDFGLRKSEELRCLEREIRDAAYKIEDIMESHISKNFGQASFHERQIGDRTFCENFVIVADEIDSIKMKADKLKKLWGGATDLHQSQRTSLPTGPSTLALSRNNAMVGFDNDLNEIMDRLTGYPPALQVIPVTGMGGIGKTTLARNVYDHPRIVLRFDKRAWVSISQEYREREVLVSLLNSTKQLNAEMHQEKSTEDLKECLYKSLKRRRYLVVMDDVWTTEALDSLRRIFPDDGIGSRIMLTTRLLSVVDSNSSPHHMQFLNKIDSWNLLRREVFGEDCCPLELEEAGKKIAENCKGLPLSLVVIGGHLSKANRTKHLWEDVAENVRAVVNAEDPNCSGILSLSYDYLPHYLKACFLYMGVFPEDYKIRVSKLIKLWVAEGFLKPDTGKTLEEVAEEYLADLISRNLIMISEKSSSGKIKTCSIHDLLRDLCIRKAQEEKFFHVADEDVNIFAEGIKYSRRLCIHQYIFHRELSNSDTSNVNPSMGSLPTFRSILCSGWVSKIYESGELKLFPLIRVLDVARGEVDGFPIGGMKLVHARYLAFSYDGKISIPKILPDFLWYLQTLIVDCEVHLPEEIWRMPQLRHLLFGKCYLPCPARSPIDGENLVLGNLLTLSKVDSSSCTKEVFERVPNLNKLGILIDVSQMTAFSPDNPINLPQLEILKIMHYYADVSFLMNFTFPPNIKKLTLYGGQISWKHMTTVGSMPNLEVLKLFRAFDGPEWEPTEGEFCKLKFLLLSDMNLVQWRAEDTDFPCLERLIIRRCFELEEIPCSIGNIPKLKIIKLDDASPSAVTWAEQIQEEQKGWGNDSLQVHVDYLFQHHRQPVKEAAEIIGGSNDDTLLLQATEQFHESFSDVSRRQERMCKVMLREEVIRGAVLRLLEFLNRDDYPQLQYKAARAIRTISIFSSDHINMLIEHGAIPILLSLLRFPNDDLCEQALHLLGRFASDSTKYRDLILSYGELMPLLAQFNDTTKLTITRAATCTLSNLCGGEPKPQFEQVKPALLPLSCLIHTDDELVLWHACWAIFYLVSGTEDGRLAVVDAGVFPRLIDLLLHTSVSNAALCAVARTISNVDDIQIQVIIDKGALPCLLNFLTHKYYFDKACGIISEIIRRSKDNLQMKEAAEIIGGSNDDTLLLQATEQFHDSFYYVSMRKAVIREVIMREEVIREVVLRLLEFLNINDFSPFQCKAARSIATISSLSSDYINMLIEHGAIPILLSLLRSPDDNLCKEALHLLGIFASDSTKYRDLILSYGELMPLLAQFNDTTKLTIMREATRTLSHLCSGEPKPQFEQVKPALVPLSRLIHTDDGEVLQHACMAISHLASGTEDGKPAVVDAGVFPRLIDLLLHPSDLVSSEALCAVAKTILDVDDIQIQVIIDKGALPCLLKFLTHKYYFDKACWIISEIVRRSKDNLQMKEAAEIIGGSNDDTLLLQATEQFHDSFYYVSMRKAVIREVIMREEGIREVVLRLLEFLNIDYFSPFQCKAVSSIATISSDDINMLIERGAIPILLSLLRSPDDNLCKEALHLLGIFASNSTKYRDLILSYGELMPLLAQFNDTTKLTIMREATLTLSHLCSGEPKPQFEQVKPALLPLSCLIHTDDGLVLWHACLAIFYLVSGTEDGRLAVVDAGVFPRLIDLLLHPLDLVSSEALCAVAKTILDVDDIQIQVIIDKGALLPCLLNFLTKKEKYCDKDSTCTIISEIIKRSKDNLQAVIEAGIISPLLQMFQDDDCFNDAAEVIYDATTKGTNEQIKLLVHEGCIEPMCDLLVNPYNVHVIKICLKGLENILKVGEAEKNQVNTDDLNVFAQMIDDACGLQKIKNLQTHDDSRVCEMAVRILETYWPEEGDE